MSELGDFLELLYSARDRFSTIKAMVRYTYQPGRIDHLMRRDAVQDSPRSVMPIESTTPNRNSTADVRTNESEEVELWWRVWWERPARWRHEQAPVDGQAMISVIDGDRWWNRSPTGDVYTNVPHPDRVSSTNNTMSPNLWDIDHAVGELTFLDPSSLLGIFFFNLRGPATSIGRQALRVVATRRPGRPTVVDPLFWNLVDELDLLVDARRGILLSYMARSDGATFASATVEQVEFDGPLPATLFTLIPASKDRVHVVQGQ